MTKKNILSSKNLGGAIYVIPNLFTTGNLFFGFFSILKATHGDYHAAAVAILLAAVFDMLDGGVARLTKGTSEFGVQYDSLCDLVSFGLAPCFLAYQYALHNLGRFGWALCFIYLACGALRLARFNVQNSIGKSKGDFVGLPIPMAAAFVACFVAYLEDLDERALSNFSFLQKLHLWLASDQVRLWCLLLILTLAAFLMVSNISYRSHKSLQVGPIKPFKTLAVSVVLIGFVAYRPAFFGFLFFSLYTTSGLIEFILGWKKARDESDIFLTLDDNDSDSSS
ncbi:MAG: CDP-diacylglycerol--serine O-phosphatidyltransferase [Zetaproteobacteria bacterium]|nr:CDP-diacylglycerol--serine O-phosphatidyltransferase [Pseudobdellovibrionaceae bacterium]|tara:strand:+ start:685 stop:1527 length:843 start_codon:yes stop_codon:yes gene_type:complete